MTPRRCGAVPNSDSPRNCAWRLTERRTPAGSSPRIERGPALLPSRHGCPTIAAAGVALADARRSWNLVLLDDCRAGAAASAHDRRRGPDRRGAPHRPGGRRRRLGGFGRRGDRAGDRHAPRLGAGLWRVVVITGARARDRRGRCPSPAMAFRDLLVALLLVVGRGLVLARVVESDWLPVEPHLCRMGVPRAAPRVRRGGHRGRGPELVRRCVARRWLVPLAALGAVALGARSPRASSAHSRSASGLGRSSGSPSDRRGRPADGRTRRAASLGVDVSDLRSRSASMGCGGVLRPRRDGGPLKVRVLGRDAQDTQRLARRWRLLAYRDPASERTRRAPRAGRARGGRDADGRAGGRARARGGHRRPRPGRRRGAGHPPARSRAARAREPRAGERRAARGAVATGRRGCMPRHLPRPAQR